MKLARGQEAIELFVKLPIAGPVLDIGSGYGFHAEHLRESGLDVITLDAKYPASIKASWPAELPYQVGGIWCCHVLEHSKNVGHFLDACKKALKVGGWLAITVPPAKHNIVGGHLSLWNAGILLYNLILAGFDCSGAKVLTEGYDISVIVQNKTTELPDLKSDDGDIENLSHLFPFDAGQGFDGEIEKINWNLCQGETK